MPRHTAAGPVLAQIALVREQIEGWDDPARTAILGTLARLKDQLEGVEAREKDEAARAASGIGAPPRFGRLR